MLKSSIEHTGNTLFLAGSPLFDYIRGYIFWMPAVWDDKYYDC
jgi:hypothetical protein